MENLEKKCFKIGEEDVVFGVSQYGAFGRKAILVLTAENGDLYGKLTVNMPEVMLMPDEIIVKTWSENEALAAAALATGFFYDTGKRIPTGFCEAQIWRIL